MSVDYGVIYNRVDRFLQTREGLANPKKASDYKWFVRELSGIFCGAAYEHNLSTESVVNFLDIVQPHCINGIVNTGKVSSVCDLISDHIKHDPLYYILERTLMLYKPASVQVGPGEFFMCFYDAGSVFGIDNTAGYDVVVDGTTTELKSLGTNLTTPEIFDKYAANPILQRLMVVKPVSGAAKPQSRSVYACIDVDKWRDAFYHRNGRTLAYKEGIK